MLSDVKLDYCVMILPFLSLSLAPSLSDQEGVLVSSLLWLSLRGLEGNWRPSAALHKHKQRCDPIKSYPKIKTPSLCIDEKSLFSTHWSHVWIVTSCWQSWIQQAMRAAQGPDSPGRLETSSHPLNCTSNTKAKNADIWTISNCYFNPGFMFTVFTHMHVLSVFMTLILHKETEKYKE